MASIYRNRDLPVLIAITFCLGSTWLSHSLGLSPILGAFVSGMLLAETPFAEQIRIDISPLQAGFVTLFFTSVGTLATISPGGLPQALLFAALIVAGKIAVVVIALKITGRSLGTALATGLALAQIGEFSFVLTELGFRLGLIGEDTLQMLISSSVITLAVTPFLISLAPNLKQAVDSRRGHPSPEKSRDEVPPGRLIVVGYGPSGRATVEHLRSYGLSCVIIELNPNTVAQHQPALPIHYGDATREEVLRHLGVESARAVVITIPDPGTCRQIIKQTKRIAPGVHVIARCRYHQQAAGLLTAGADHIVDEESIIGSSIARKVAELIDMRSKEPGE
jgi:CPA2 family monovalent cation:H+ antiporter-2